MKKNWKLFRIIRNSSLTIIFILVFPLFLNPNQVQANTDYTSYEITISATIGEPKLTLFGYSSPNSLIELNGQQVAEETIADKTNGYFLFDRIFLPTPILRTVNNKPTLEYPELCLNAIDTQSRISFPVCLPSLPTGLYDLKVGPVLLPPTISLEKGNFLPKDLINAQGLTIPNAEVDIFLANEAGNKKSSISKLINMLNPSVFAYSLPQYKIKADSQGRFDFNLPTVKSTNWRLFASSQFQGSPGPKSNTLNFKVLNWWEWFCLVITNVFNAFLRLIKPFWWLLIVLIELIMISSLLFKFKKGKQRSISNF